MSDAWELSPKPMPVGHADGQRDDVLDRAAELDADDVGVRVRPEVRRHADLLELLGDGLVGAGDDAGRRLALGDLLGEVRPGDDGDPLGRGTGRPRR